MLENFREKNHFNSKKWLSILLTLLLIIQVMTISVYAAPADTSGQWTVRSPLPSDNNIYEVCYGNGIYVAAGSGGTVLTSSDGAAWESHDLGVGYDLSGVCYGDGIFVAAGQNGTILTSEDGEPWQSQTSGTTDAFSAVSYGAGTFVAVGSGSTIYTSPDGAVWTGHDSGSSGPFDGVCYGKETFVAVGYTGKIYTSTDGATWTYQTSGDSVELMNVRYINNMFVAVGYSHEIILTSPDGITWTEKNFDEMGFYNTLYGVSYGNGTYYAVGKGGKILTSTDGDTWTHHDLPGSYDFQSISYINDAFVLTGLGGAILTSSDGVNWASRGAVTGQDLYGISYGNSTYAAVGDYGVIVTSSDGAEWNLQDSGTSQCLHSIVYGDGNFVAVGGYDTIVTSSDGNTWSSQALGSEMDLYSVTYGGGTFVAVGNGGTILTSSDGLNWNDYTLADDYLYIGGVCYGNDTFVAVGSNIDNKDVILTSENGITWSTDTLDTEGWFNGISFINNAFMAVESDGTIMTSGDGATWNSRDSGSDTPIFKAGYGGGFYLAVGDHNTSLTSNDGTAWVSRDAGLSYYSLNDVVYADNSFMTLGSGGLILQVYPPVITGVTVSPSTPSVEKGTTQQFTADVTGEYNPEQTVTWSVTSGTSTGTTIDGDGLLTVASDETSTSLTVKAISTVDAAKFGTTDISVPSGSGGSGDDESGSGGHRTSAKTAPAFMATINANESVVATETASLDSKTGMLMTVLSAGNLNSALAEAKTSGHGITEVTVSMPEAEGADSYLAKLPAAVLNTKDPAVISIETAIGTVAAPNNMLSRNDFGAGTVGISIGTADPSGLDAEIKKQIADKPVIELKLTSGSSIVSWNNPDAPVTVSIPYAPTKEELDHPESIVVWYIDGSGNVVSIPSGHYDAETGTVTFQTTHFSEYAVAYNKVSFNDVPDTSWYSDAVNFIAARGITSGTSDGTYSPKAFLTRGEFIVLMMRAYDIKPDTDAADNFADAGNTYYTGYLAAAKRLGISGGTGGNLFAPGKAVTRQEMFTMLYNTLKIIGELPQATSGTSLSDFSDARQIASWAKEAMKLLTESGIISGSSGKLAPANTTTRAEMTQVLYQLLAK